MLKVLEMSVWCGSWVYLCPFACALASCPFFCRTEFEHLVYVSCLVSSLVIDVSEPSER
jgi:hypothetical protein